MSEAQSNVRHRGRQASKLASILRSKEYRSAFRQFGVAAATEHADVLRRLSLGLVIDVGANRGQFATAVRRHHPNAKLIAVEPVCEAFRVLEQLPATQSDTKLHNCAVGDRAGRFVLHVASSDDASSLLPPVEHDPSSWAPVDWEERDIEVVRLDSIVPLEDLGRGSLLKLDVQGFELSALRGLSPEHLESLHYVYAEVSFQELYAGQPLIDEIIDHLRSAGFVLETIGSLGRDGTDRVVQADVLFRNDRFS